jgi:trimeric autotransporter adhesin
MSGVKRGVTLVFVMLAVLAGWTEHAVCQMTTTTVQDTVYRADGTVAGGTVLVSWSAFTTMGGQAVAAGSTSAAIGTGGALSIALAPNAGATPMGSYYTAVFHLNDGTTNREYWVIPVTIAGGGPVRLAAIESQVLPISVAMQTVSKQYVDNAIAAAETGFPLDASPYVLKAGDAMTGPLVLPADPVSPSQAADKNYVDTNVASIAGGLGQKVSTLPTGTQVVAQPSGTQLQVNNLNGELFASPYVTGAGNNGIVNALASPNCTSGCKLEVEPTYTGTDPVYVANIPSGGVVEDARGGAIAQTVVNPLGPRQTYSAARSITQVETMSSPQLEALRPGAIGVGAAALTLQTQAVTGGSNQFPSYAETPPYFKSTYSVLSLSGTYNTQGQHIQLNNDVACYSVGDCLAGAQFIASSGGYRDAADEGTHPFDLQITEDTQVYQGTCATGCTTGSTNLSLTATQGGGTQGDGRFLIDRNASKVISSGSLIAGVHTIFGAAGFSGTSFPVSVFLTTTQAATSQPTNMAPGTVTLAIATSGVTGGFSTSTAALPASSGVACVADTGASTVYEMANYSVVDATHVQLTLNKVHLSGATIAVGGLCGYGLEQTVDTVNGIRQVFPVVGSINPTEVYYVAGGTPVVGTFGNGSTGGYVNIAVNIASISRTGNVVTVTTASNPLEELNGLSLTIGGVADSSYNGTFVATTTGPNTLTYANAGSNSTSSGGTVSIVTGGFALYPMAEVLSVAGAGSKQVDGTFTLAPNTVAWAAGDLVEQPHYYQQLVMADTEIVTQYLPRPVQYAEAGKLYQGNASAGLRGWQITNGTPASSYLGAGGTHATPDDAYVVSGPWSNDFDVEAGVDTVIAVHCNLNGCNRWNSGYNLFALDSNGGKDTLAYRPQDSTATFTMGGSQYIFAAAAFSAGTINVGILNASTINGGVTGAAITSGTISAARLPLFGPSGTTHAPGIVPDPGATAGATRYLREDGTWATPAGGGGGGGGSPTGAAGGGLGGSYPNPSVVTLAATGGTIDNVTIGGTTPAAGNFTTINASGAINVTIPGSVGGTAISMTQPALGIGNNLCGVGFGTSITTGNSVFNCWWRTGSSAGFGSFETYGSASPVRLGGSTTVISGPTIVGTGSAGGTLGPTCGAVFCVNSGSTFTVDASGNAKALGYAETLTTPATSSASCTAGSFTDDANYHYVCVAANTWKRAALSSF